MSDMSSVLGALPRRRLKSSSQRSTRKKVIADQRRGLAEQIVWRTVSCLKPFPQNPRLHPEAQVAALTKSISRFWTIPILVDESLTILAGHLRWEAAKRLGMTEVPTIMITGLSESEKRAIVIADNRLPEQAIWDFDLLREHFTELIELDFDVELSGFSTGEIDLILDSNIPKEASDPADDLIRFALDGPTISKLGDLWEVGRHHLFCGNALERHSYERVLQGDLAQMVAADPPYNVKIVGHAMGRGKIRHRDFKMVQARCRQPNSRTFSNIFFVRQSRSAITGQFISFS